MSLTTICELSHEYGAKAEYVLAGGGNTSFKDEQYLYVKPSGVKLASIEEEEFVKMERVILRECFTWNTFVSKEEREAKVKKLMAYAVTYGSSGRPSVEAPLHELMPFSYVVHLHPAKVNGMTCALNGKEACTRMFPDALWVDYVDPGLTLAMEVYRMNADYVSRFGHAPKVIFLQNHGVFVGGDTDEEIRRTYEEIMNKLDSFYAEKNVSPEQPRLTGEEEAEQIDRIAPVLRGLLGDGELIVLKSNGDFNPASGPLTPDHLVYAKAFALTTEEAQMKEDVSAFHKKYGYLPKVVQVRNVGVFTEGDTLSCAKITAQIAWDAHCVERYADAFGGIHYLTDEQRLFIEKWEAESYRKQVSAGGAKELKGRVAVVTGGAQGFGFGIAEILSRSGAEVVIADRNLTGALAAAKKIGHDASAFEVDIADEDSVQKLVHSVVATYGGVDLLVANAGVLKAGSVKDYALKDWEFVTRVNYIGFFLCVKHFSRVMGLQNQFRPFWSDIVQVNSKSGLTGSKNNGAYAGSKFGTIGLTQSFAMELVTDHIKVNSICPGNYFEGPLWSDPERGLFVQYLNTGKVRDAKTVADVKKYYEDKVLMGRGCYPEDVARAIIYTVIQAYETGQAVPVTGGQTMLN